MGRSPHAGILTLRVLYVSLQDYVLDFVSERINELDCREERGGVGCDGPFGRSLSACNSLECLAGQNCESLILTKMHPWFFCIGCYSSRTLTCRPRLFAGRTSARLFFPIGVSTIDVSVYCDLMLNRELSVVRCGLVVAAWSGGYWYLSSSVVSNDRHGRGAQEWRIIRVLRCLVSWIPTKKSRETHFWTSLCGHHCGHGWSSLSKPPFIGREERSTSCGTPFSTTGD